MATTRNANGSGPGTAATTVAHRVTAPATEAGEAVASAARRASKPAVAVGAAAAGLAGGLALGARAGSKRRGLGRSLLAPRPRLLGIPIGPKPPVVRAAKALRDGAKHAGRATTRVSAATDEMRRTREQIEQLNRRSPIEVLLDGLTHRRGAHRTEN